MQHFTPIRVAALAAMLTLSSGLANAAPLDTRDVVHDTYGHKVVNSFGYCVRTVWDKGVDQCAATGARPLQSVVTTQREQIALDQRTVYFDFNKATLTQDSRRKLNNLAANLKSDSNVREARIVGYADRIGSESYNDRLSQRRAKAVQDYLSKRGVINTRVTETRWFGESVPVTQCPDGLTRKALIACLSKDRRVEVEVDYLPGAEQNVYNR